MKRTTCKIWIRPPLYSRGISQCLRSGILPGGLRRQNWALGDVTKYSQDWGGGVARRVQKKWEWTSLLKGRSSRSRMWTELKRWGQQRSCSLCFKFLLMGSSLSFSFSFLVSKLVQRAWKQFVFLIKQSLRQQLITGTSLPLVFSIPVIPMAARGLGSNFSFPLWSYFILTCQYLCECKEISVLLFWEVRGGCKIIRAELCTAGKRCWFHFCQAANRC